MILNLEDTLSEAFNSSSDYFSSFSDVLLLGNGRVDVTIPPITQIFTRVLCADGESHLYVHRKDETADSRHVLYLIAPTTQGTIFIHLADTSSESTGYELSLDRSDVDGPDSIGFVITFYGNRISPEISFLSSADVARVEVFPDSFMSMLSAQLLAATALFWQYPGVALDITSHVQFLTTGSVTAKFLYMQAQSIADWLATSISAGDKAHGVPSLSVQEYETAVGNIYQVASIFDENYKHLSDSETSKEERLAAWDASVEQAEDFVSLQDDKVAKDEAAYAASLSALARIENDFNTQTVRLAGANAKFAAGIDVYLEEQKKLEILDLSMKFLCKSSGSYRAFLRADEKNE